MTSEINLVRSGMLKITALISNHHCICFDFTLVVDALIATCLRGHHTLEAHSIVGGRISFVTT